MDSHFLQLDNRKGQDRTMHSLNTEQIQQIIPHRHPFLLIDQIEDYVPGEYAVGYKGVSYHEDFFRGHFPQKAVMPGVLILEALAQTGAVAILSLPENRGKIAFSEAFRSAGLREWFCRETGCVWKRGSSKEKVRSGSVKRQHQ